MMKYTVRIALFVTAGLMALGCGETDDGAAMAGESDGVVDVTSQTLTSEMNAKFTDYAQALLDEDLQTLDGVTSREVKERVRRVGSDTRRFAKKMRASMLTEFSTIAEGSDLRGRFTVQSLRQEGDALRAEIAFDGKTLPKPFYFVGEDGEYKLNVRRPGFANELPEGSGGASDNYLIRNTTPITESMFCTGSGLFDVLGNAEKSKSCGNKCGVWHGSIFWSFSFPTQIKCDYNTWGVDVFIESNRLRCNDGC